MGFNSGFKGLSKYVKKYCLPYEDFSYSVRKYYIQIIALEDADNMCT